MNKNILIWILTLILLSSFGFASVIQNQTNIDASTDLGTSAGGNLEERAGQVTANNNLNNIESISLYLSSILNNPDQDVTVRIETDSSGLPSGSLVDVNAVTTIAKENLTVGGVWVNGFFTNSFNIAPATIFHIVLRSPIGGTSNKYQFGVLAGVVNMTSRSINSGAWVETDGEFAYIFNSTLGGNFTITSNLNNFSGFLDGISYITNTSIIKTLTPSNSTDLFNVTVSPTNFTLNATYLNYNVSNDLVVTFPLLNVTATNILTDDKIQNFSININNVAQSYSEDFITTNFSIQNNLVKDLDYIVTLTADGFVPSSQNINLTADTNLEFEMNQIGDLQINILNTSDGSQFKQNVTLKIQNSTSQRTVTLENGSDFISGLNYGTEYILIFSSDGFSTNLYNLLYSEEFNQVPFDAYLTKNDSEEVQYRIQDSRDVNLEDALVQVERFVNDTRVLVGSQLSDVSGLTTFLLDITETVVVTVTKDGYTTESHVLNAPLQTELTLKLTFIAPVNYTNRMSGIVWSYAPTTTEINPDIVNFTLFIDAIDNNLELYNITVYNYTQVFGVNSSINPNGETLILPINVSNLVNQTIFFRITFKKDGFEPYTQVFAYIVKDFDNSYGSLRATRLWFQNNTDIKTRVAFWIILMIIGTVSIASVSFKMFNDPTKGFIILMPYAILTGYIVAIHWLVLGFVGSIMILSIILIKRDSGLE